MGQIHKTASTHDALTRTSVRGIEHLDAELSHIEQTLKNDLRADNRVVADLHRQLQDCQHHAEKAAALAKQWQHYAFSHCPHQHHRAHEQA